MILDQKTTLQSGSSFGRRRLVAYAPMLQQRSAKGDALKLPIGAIAYAGPSLKSAKILAIAEAKEVCAFTINLSLNAIRENVKILKG